MDLRLNATSGIAVGEGAETDVTKVTGTAGELRQGEIPTQQKGVRVTRKPEGTADVPVPGEDDQPKKKKKKKA